jgi:transcriptional regulator with XRE-family HTH domain
METSAMTRALREQAGLSLRALADAADVSFTTIFRIERGDIDPTLGTLRKILRATGHDLALTDREGIHDLASLATRWEHSSLGDRPDWTLFRGLLDTLSADPSRTAVAIARRPIRSGSAFIDNLLAAIAEKSADDADLKRPAWTREIPPLAEPYRPPRPGWRHAEIAPQFEARGLEISQDSLWHEPAHA